MLNALRRAASELDVARWARFDAAAYTAVQVAVVELGELWLMSWLPGQETAVHDHGGAACAELVMAGELVEERFRRAGDRVVELDAVARLRAGDASVGRPNVVHRVRALSRVVTLHLFAPRRTAGRAYEVIA